MFIKDWTCTNCKLKKEIIYPERIPIPCPNCGSRSCRVIYRKREDFKPFGVQCGVDALMVEHERLSNAMACLPSEIPRMMKAHPGSEYKVCDDGLARLVIKNRHEKIKALKSRGYVEYE